MDPLVEEYNNNKERRRGTELKALTLAEEKTKKFTYQCFAVTLGVFVGDVIVKMVYG
jgi:hypothetical protein